MQQCACARNVRHRPSGAAHHGTTTSLRLDNRPAKSFETRWGKQRVRAIVKRLEHFVRCIHNFDNTMLDVEITRLCAETGAQCMDCEPHLRIECVYAFGKNA